ncbi:ROK family protein [Streptomyces sp. NBC_00873]|uniref:ROK family transcriptional regulator n=1 Tax=unclassified Streptomyces TaxID=2593676 RepID=UPI0038641CD8|nr:ROK family protein [Streptomyces sp. NBC_00873]WTA43986.1 ROK family protein [Streptomyces sp. NBC_00842]
MHPDVPAANAAPLSELLRLFRDGRPRTRAELTAETGMARSTVRTRLDALLDAGLVHDAGSGASTGGRPAGRFVFNARARVALAADVGATHATLAVTDLTDTTLATGRLTLDISDGPATVLPQLVDLWRGLLAEAGLESLPLAGVGVGLPGPVEHSTGRPQNPPIMPGWDGYDVPGHLAADFGVPVLVDNEVNLMALGEHTTRFPDTENLILVKVATGIGAGIISNGRLHRGAVGAAGDMGHILAPRGGEVPCRCGNKGCLEAVASGAAIAAALRELGLEAHSNADVVSLVRKGNVVASQAVRQAGRDIGEVLAGCVSMLNPSLIVVGGSLAKAGEMLLAGVREAIYGRSLPMATQQLSIVASRAGAAAGMLGAAAMVVQHALSPAVLDSELARPAGMVSGGN